jgi:hypothetical protein
MAFNVFDAMYPELMPSPEMEQQLPRRRRRVPVDAVEQIQLPEPEPAPEEPVPAPAPETAPEVEQGVLSKIGNTALSGLSVIGSALDLVPSMIRDVATLDNPFDQLLTPFSAENRNTGRDVLTKWGMTKPNDPDKWEAADFLGFGVDVASGLPMAGIGLGGKALTDGGKALSKAGLLDDLMRVAPATTPGKLSARISTTVDDIIKPRLGEELNPLYTAGSKEAMERQGRLMDAASAMGIDDVTPLLQQKVGGIADLRLPFAPTNIVGTGGTALKYANKLDEGLRKVHDFEIPGTGIAPIADIHSLFDSTIGEAGTAMGRRLMRPLLNDRRDAMYAARGEIGDLAQELIDNGGQFADNSVDSSRALRRVMEGYDAPQNAGVQNVRDKARTMLDQMVPDANEWGVKLDNLKEVITQYFPRRKTKEMNVGVGRGSKVLNATDDFAEMREPFLRDLGEGTDSIFQLVDDPTVKQLLDNNAPVADIEKAIANHFGRVFQATGKLTGDDFVNEAGKQVYGRYGIMADWLKKMDPETRASGVFGNHPLQDLLGRTTAANESLSTAKNILTNLADDTVLAEAKRLAGKNTDTVTLKEVLKNAGMDVGYGLDSNGDLIGGNALQKYLKLKGVPPGQITKDMMDAAADTPIPAKFAKDIGRVSELFNGPEPAKNIIKLYDNFTSLFKVGVLTTPRFHARNLVSGQVQNMLTGMWSRRSTAAMQNIMTGKGADIGKVPIIAEELRRAGLPNTPENAADMFRKLAYRFNMVPKFEQQTMSRAPLPQGTTIDDIIGSMPGGTFRGRGTAFAPLDQAKEVLKGGKGTSGTTWNPTQATWRGINDATDNTFAPVAASDIAGHYVEGMNRGAPFLELLMKGVHPKEAARRVLDAQIDYGSGALSQTKTSREVMTRIFPFWKFTKGAVPYTLRQLYETPGGATSQVARTTGLLGAQDPTTPDHVASSTSIPLGTGDDGTRKYLTGLGLMHEAPIDMVFGSNPILKQMSSMNPLIQAPLQLGTKESFFQEGPMGGRDLSAMDPPIGRTASNIASYLGRESTDPITFPGSDALEFVLSNSPLSAIINTGRTLSDPRKGILDKAANLGTGLRITDVSPAAQDAVLRERIQQLQRELGGRDFDTVTINAERLARMSPQQRAAYEELKRASNTLTKRAKQRKAVKELAVK